MSGEQNSGKEPGRHISMELTADGARVTSLSLRGSRLMLTIEAELADSELLAAETAAAAAARTGRPRRDTEFVTRSATSPVGGPGAGSNVPEGASGFAAMGSENIAAACAARFHTDPHYQCCAGTEAESPATDTQPIFDAASAAIAATPPLEPVLEVTETWDDPIPNAQSVEEVRTPDPHAPEGFMYAATPGTAQPAVAPVRENIRSAASLPPTDPHAPEEAPQMRNTSDRPAFATDPHSPSYDDGPLAIAEESSAIGGERHGEPLPTFSFGSFDSQTAPSSLPATDPHYQPQEENRAWAASQSAQTTPPPLPATDPHYQEPQEENRAWAASQSIQTTPPPLPATDPHYQEPQEENRAWTASQSVQTTPPPLPATDPHYQEPQEENRAWSASQSVQTTPPPLPATDPHYQEPQEENRTRSARQSAQTTPSSLPATDPHYQEPREDDRSRGDGGGTTVLIRYTCPKCKTQGMQAVDKVGTVVNCSNCGKAMRLVMKK